MRVALSASFHWIAWKRLMVLPNAVPLARVPQRGFVRALREADRQRRDADAPGVEHLQRVDEPLPFLAQEVVGGTRQPSKSTSLVSLARMPSLSSFLPAVMPGVPRSMMNAEMPFGPAARSVTAIATQHVARRAVRREGLRSVQHPAVARRARPLVRRPPASLPEFASVSAQAPSFSPRASGTRYVCFCASRSEHRDVGGAQAVVRGNRQRDGRVDARQLFDADAVVDGRHAGAAVLLRPLDAQQPESRRASGSARPENAAPRPTP